MFKDIPTATVQPWLRSRLNTRRKSVLVAFVSPNSPHTLRGGWSDGSRDTFAAFDINTHAPISLDNSVGTQWLGDKQPEQPWLQPNNSVLVVGGTFCGKPAFVKLYIATDNESEAGKKLFITLPC